MPRHQQLARENQVVTQTLTGWANFCRTSGARNKNPPPGKRCGLWRTRYHLLRGALQRLEIVLVFFPVPPFTRQAAGL
jgi:hypothetical protein